MHVNITYPNLKFSRGIRYTWEDEPCCLALRMGTWDRIFCSEALQVLPKFVHHQAAFGIPVDSMMVEQVFVTEAKKTLGTSLQRSPEKSESSCFIMNLCRRRRWAFPRLHNAIPASTACILRCNLSGSKRPSPELQPTLTTLARSEIYLEWIWKRPLQLQSGRQKPEYPPCASVVFGPLRSSSRAVACPPYANGPLLCSSGIGLCLV